MVVIFTYDLSASGERRNQLTDQIQGILNRYRWAKRLSTNYIVELNTEADRDYLYDSLITFDRHIPEEFFFIISPIFRGRFLGKLENGNDWEFVNLISN